MSSSGQNATSATRFTRAMLMTAAACLLVGCSGTAADTASRTPTPTPTASKPSRSVPTYTWSTAATTPFIVVPPNPRASYTHSCDYLLGDFTSNTSKGYRFIAAATIHNTGNVGVVAKITATWYPVGLSPVSRSHTRKVAKGKTARSNFVIPISQDTLSAYQANADPSSSCKVKVQLVETFGTPS